jgi:hypothetical protein
MDKHTPGPWRIYTDRDEDSTIRTILGPNDRREVAIVTTGGFDDATERANAQLIAAAPRMLADLIAAADALDALIETIEAYYGRNIDDAVRRGDAEPDEARIVHGGETVAARLRAIFRDVEG